jgi:hypothetical protein
MDLHQLESSGAVRLSLRSADPGGPQGVQVVWDGVRGARNVEKHCPSKFCCDINKRFASITRGSSK